MFHSMQVFASCSGREFERHAESLLASIDINSPGQRVVLHVFDPGVDFEHRVHRIQKRLRSTLLEVSTERSQVSGIAARDKERSSGAQNFAALADYFCAKRLDTLCLDIGALVLRDLYAFPSIFPEADLAIFCEVGTSRTSAQVRTGVVWLRATSVTRKFVGRVAGEIDSSGYADDTALLNVLKAMPELQVQSLSARFVTSEPGDQSVICLPKERSVTGQAYQVQAAAILAEFHTDKTIAILCPRVDLGFKAGLSKTTMEMRKRLSMHGRLYWHYFPKIIRDVLNEEICRAEIICRPLWEIDNALVAQLPHDVVFVPHKNRQQVRDARAVFYMQELYPFFFTVDENGWAASSSHYASAAFRAIGDTRRAETFVEEVRNKRVTKYPQSEANYGEFDVFFPLQVPRDETLRFHSDYSLKEIVHAVIDWAERYGRRVLFKRHPQNRDVGYLDVDQRKLRSCRFVSKGNVHDLLAQAKVVFVVNSGVGFEALLHNKPLVVFGRAMYDVVALRGTLDVAAIEETYQKVLMRKVPRDRYLKFIEWYLFHAGILLDRPLLDVNLPQVKCAAFPNKYHEELTSLLHNTEADTVSFVKHELAAQLIRGMYSLARWPGERLQELLEFALPRVLPVAYFRDRRVALVSRETSMLELGLGADVDTHELVIRIDTDHPLAVRKGLSIDHETSEKWLAGSLEDKRIKPDAISWVISADAPRSVKERYTNILDLGEKTSVWAFATTDRHRQRFCREAYRYVMRVWMRTSFYTLHIRLWPYSQRLPSEYQSDLRERLSIEPSPSLVFFELLRRVGVAQLDLYGFDFSIPGQTAVNQDKDKGDLESGPDAEFEYVHGLVAANPGFRLCGFRYERVPVGYHAGHRVGLLGFGDAEADHFRRLFPGSNVVRELSRIHEKDVSVLEHLDVFVWGRLDSQSEATIRSHGMAVTRASHGPARNAWCFDKAGLYTDSSEPSELLYMLRHLDVTSELGQWSDIVFKTLGYPAELPRPRQLKRVLVITEEEGEEDQLAALAKLENPGVVVTLIGSDRSDTDVLHPFGLERDIFSDMACVYTRSAPLALVAVLRGIRTIVLGKPFYAGWGLTDDRMPLHWRTRKLTRQKLFTAAVLLYPRYFSPGGEFGLPPEFLSK